MKSFLALAAILLLPDVELPDLAKGSINGRVAVLLMPRFAKEVIEPKKCIARLVPHKAPDTELSFPCGVWFQPPPDSYRFWLEKEDLIGPVQNVLVYSGGPFKERGLGGVFDVVPGGRIQLARDRKIGDSEQLRLLHVDSHKRDGFVKQAFERRVPAARAHDPVLMPAGRVIAALMDRNGDVLSVTKPIDLRDRSSISVAPRPPQNGADVVVIFSRPRTFSTTTPDELVMSLHTEERARPPDVFIASSNRFYGFWFGISASKGTLEVKSKTLALPAVELKFKAGSVATVRRTLSLLPSVNVSINAPSGVFEGLKPTVDFVAPGERLVRQMDVAPPGSRAEYLPAEQLRIALRIGSWRFVRAVDLREFGDEDVVFELKPIVISGTVFDGPKAARAELKFYIGPEWVNTTTDAEGRYELTLWEPRMYAVEVQLLTRKTEPFREYFVQITESQSRDFRIPDSRVRVAVVDSDSGAAIPIAEVSVLNIFREGTGPEQRTAQSVTADEQGYAWLPPLRPGSASIAARAKGYLESQPVVVQIAEAADPRTVPLQLRATGESSTLILRTAGMQPAAGADVAIALDPAGVIIWRSSTAEDGSIQVPKKFGGAVVLIRHPSAGALARVWDGRESEWRLPLRGLPLVVKASHANGEPARSAEVILWLDGNPVRGDALAFLTRTTPLTNGDGYWKAAGLAVQPIEILVMRRVGAPLIRSFARAITVPWPNEVATRLVE